MKNILNRFGVGYNLTIVKKNTEPSPDIEKLVFSYIKSAKCLSEVAAEISFQLPLQELPNFKDLFHTLDEKLDELQIASYGISITTLEEVFLKVAEGNDLNHSRFSRIEKEKDFIDDFDLNSVKIKGKFDIFLTHFWALMKKRLNYFKRDKKGLVCEIILPCLIIVVGLCLTFIKFVYPSPALALSPSLLKQPINAPIQNNQANFYSSENFPGNYFNWLTSNTFDNNDIYAFDDYAFGKRFSDDNGLYGAFFINHYLNSNYSYFALVKLIFFIIFYIFYSIIPQHQLLYQFL